MPIGIRRALSILAVLVVFVPTGARATTETIAPPFDDVWGYAYAPESLALNRSTTSASADATLAGDIDLAASVQTKLGGQTVFASTANASAVSDHYVSHPAGSATSAIYTIRIHINNLELTAERKPTDLVGSTAVRIDPWISCDTCSWSYESILYWFEPTTISDDDEVITVFVEGNGEPLGEVTIGVFSSASVIGGVRQSSFSATLDADVVSLQAII